MCLLCSNSSLLVRGCLCILYVSLLCSYSILLPTIRLSVSLQLFLAFFACHQLALFLSALVCQMRTQVWSDIWIFEDESQKNRIKIRSLASLHSSTAFALQRTRRRAMQLDSIVWFRIPGLVPPDRHLSILAAKKAVGVRFQATFAKANMGETELPQVASRKGPVFELLRKWVWIVLVQACFLRLFVLKGWYFRWNGRNMCLEFHPLRVGIS